MKTDETEKCLLFSYDAAELSRINGFDLSVSETVDLQQLLTAEREKKQLAFIVRDDVVCFDGIGLISPSFS